MENKIFKIMQQVESKHWWFVARRKIISKAINCIVLPKHTRILEAGCGNGDNLALLSNFGDVTAFEKNADAFQRAKSKKIGRIYNAELPDNLPDDIKSNFDLIVLLDVLEHIDDDSKSLSIVRNLMSNNGVILITVPAFQWLWSRHDDIHQHSSIHSPSQYE